MARIKNYINNKDLYEEMVKYKAEYEKDNQCKISNYIGECILLIANRVSNKPNFSGYTYKDEMISDAIENTILYLHNFDPQKTQNPFAYITQIVIYAFIRRIQREKKEQYTKLKMLQNYITEEELVDNGLMTKQLYDNNNDYIQEYEDSLVEKRNKIKKKTGIEKFIEE